MPDFSKLDRLVDKVTFFPGLTVRLACLKQLQETTEEQLDIARRLAVQRVRADHQRLSTDLHPEDRAYDFAELEQRVTHQLPQLLRGGLILTVWSVFERTTKDIAFRSAAYVGQPLAESYFRKGGLLRRLDQVIKSSAGVSVLNNSADLTSIQLLQDVRNLLIHHDGRLIEASAHVRSMSHAAREALGLRVERDYDHEYVVPESTFVATSSQAVYNFVHALASDVFEALVPPGSDA